MIQDIKLLRTEEYRRMLAGCIHCGMCLEACPTYAIFGTEMDGPRGRISLMRAVVEKQIGLDDFRDSFSRHITLCLACRACETACPSGVRYGELVEKARIVVEHNRKPGLAELFLRWLGTQKLMPNQSLLRLLARLVWVYEHSGTQRLIRSIGFLPKSLAVMEGILPSIELRFTSRDTLVPAQLERRGRVLFFTGCIQDAFLSPVNQATVRVLQRNGYEVLAPGEQTCCGAAHLHLGDVDGAQSLARQNIETFLAESEEYDAVICNAGGCGLSLKEYPHLLKNDLEYVDRARKFAESVRDVSEFLVEHLRTAPKGEVRARATYADSCHLRHGQKVVTQPRQLLQAVAGLELVELAHPDRCCGSAGVYNIAQADTAEEVLDAKMADIEKTGAELIITSNTGCQLQLIAGARRAGLDAKVVHVIEVLDWAYDAEGPDRETGAAG